MMISWNEFPYFGITAMSLWIMGSLVAWRYRHVGTFLFGTGVVLFALYIVLFWNTLGRAPMRTMGETRLWYSMFVSLTVLILYARWRFHFLLLLGAVLSSVFTLINIFRPEIHTSELMPALQSAWFIPHVTVYMLAYAIVAAAQIVAFSAITKPEHLQVTDALVRIGTALILIGMLMGAVWAKQAWGNYWTWDAKENWAAVTWLLYLLYIHIRIYRPKWRIGAIITLTIAFLALQVTWYGVNYLPSASKSVHTYSMSKN